MLSNHLVAANVLFDTGAGKSYIDPKTALQLSDCVRTYSKPQPVFQFDGQPPASGPILEYVDTTIVFNRKTAFSIRLSVSPMFAKGIVVGEEWMSRHQALINLRDRTITLSSYATIVSTPIERYVPLVAPSTSSTLAQPPTTTREPSPSCDNFGSAASNFLDSSTSIPCVASVPSETSITSRATIAYVPVWKTTPPGTP